MTFSLLLCPGKGENTIGNEFEMSLKSEQGGSGQVHDFVIYDLHLSFASKWLRIYFISLPQVQEKSCHKKDTSTLFLSDDQIMVVPTMTRLRGFLL